MRNEPTREDATLAPTGSEFGSEFGSVGGPGSDDSLGVTHTRDASGPVAGAKSGGPEIAPDKIARFVVLEQIGLGGMGVVYAAWDPTLDRRVALKLVRADRGSADAHDRLQREAQAMARLSHPNVVSVFDVGSHGESVWIAMEYVDGMTLRRWLNSEARSWERILELFRAAGEGLAAAHLAGLVHRDFKPDNVLIGTDERVLVADFGLVRPTHDGSAPGPAGPPEDDEAQVDAHDRAPEAELSSLDPDLTVGGSTHAATGVTTPAGAHPTPGRGRGTAPLTRAGALVGTPRYMSPEQFQRSPADARSDQFSFCVALYEALYGYPPFAGARLFEIITAVTLGEPRPPPRDSPVPASIGRAIMRGLSREPNERFADMRGLLDALAVEAPRDQLHRWPWLLAILVAAGLAAASAAWLVTSGEPQPIDVCEKGRARIADAWGPEPRAALARSFGALELSYADTSLAAVSVGLDLWSREWAAYYATTCATRHEQSSELYDLRMACLGQRLEQVQAFVALLGQADAELVSEAPRLVTTLPTLDSCADVEALRAIEAPSAELLEPVRGLREALARVQARLEAERLNGLEAELARVREQAERIGYEPLLAELVGAEAGFAGISGNRERERAHLLRAHELALGLGHDRLALDTALALIQADNFGPNEQGLELARRWSTVAAGLSRRNGQPADAEIERRRSLGLVLSRNTHYLEAIEQQREAVTLSEQTYGTEQLRTAEVRLALVIALGEAGQLAEAGTQLDAVVGVFERVLDPMHPLLLGPLRARMLLAQQAGALDDALIDGRRMQSIAEAAFGIAHARTLPTLEAVAQIHDLRGDHLEARERFEMILERSGQTATLQSKLGINTGNSLCFTLYKLGELAQARSMCERAQLAAERERGPEHLIVAIILNNLGLIARAEGDARGGLEHDRRALAICEASVGPTHPYTAYSLIGIGQGLLALGQPDSALEPLTRARAIRAEVGDPGELGEAECLLARARIESDVLEAGPEDGEDPPPRELAREGLVKLRAAGPNWIPHAQACEPLAARPD
ncbi:serine/threonine-protein kinase [Enhygromyxa salina]|uniref:Serine/threonine-protein kinase PK-1 n=1 Tax=Enhygromyxa salina TaxID=215803 RepID=A0A2S9Y469_9BACT|nr:serine/threonine-protein kinase [Enhygromyxa salina]PRP99897.1 Serine/threonine-protein kinase PK-1 [Enhygromyxa salina]